jgi:hypothetical protein
MKSSAGSLLFTERYNAMLYSDCRLMRMLLSVVLLNALVIGCGEKDSRMDGLVAPKFSQLTARKALIDFLGTSKNGALKMSMNVLSKKSALIVDESTFSIGPWQVNHRQLTFYVAIDAPPIFEDYSGHFEIIEGKWVAVLDSERRN